MNIATVYISLSLTLFLVASTQADTLYKSVDESGNVSFSDTPPPENSHQSVETIKPQVTNTVPAHTEQGSNQKQADNYGTARQKQRAEAWTEYDANLSSAKKAVKTAKKALTEGKKETEADRVGVFSNGRQAGSRLNDNYFKRVEQLEAKLKKARKRLHAIKKHRPTLLRP